MKQVDDGKPRSSAGRLLDTVTLVGLVAMLVYGIQGCAV